MNILECADPGGSVGQSAQGHHQLRWQHDPGQLHTGRRRRELLRFRLSRLHGFPNSALGEQPDDQPTCNQTNPCVLYVGQDQNDFTAPKVFSAPFLVTPGSGVSTDFGRDRPDRAAAPARPTRPCRDRAPSAASSSGRRGRSEHDHRGRDRSLANTGPSCSLDVARRDGCGSCHRSGSARAPACASGGSVSIVAPDAEIAAGRADDDVPISLRIKPGTGRPGVQRRTGGQQRDSCLFCWRPWSSSSATTGSRLPSGRIRPDHRPDLVPGHRINSG